MQFDIFVPSLQLAIEYQGAHHFNDHIFFGSQKKYSQRDQEKREACKRVGITLIEIPYWCLFDKENLVAAINEHLSIPQHIICDSPVVKAH